MKLPLKDLEEYKAKNKFSNKEWQKRNVNPSDKGTNMRMNNLVNICIDEITHSKDVSEKSIASIIDENLEIANKSWFDTEETDFIFDIYYELSEILKITSLVKEFRKIYFYHQQNKIYNSEIHEGHEMVDCKKCGQKLEMIILEQINDYIETIDEEFTWTIVTCNFCNELNILKQPKSAKRTVFESCASLFSFNTYDEATKKMIELKKPLNFENDDFSDKDFLDFIKGPIGKKIKYFSVLMSKENDILEPLMFWLNTGEKVWYRFFIDACHEHWHEYNEIEKEEIIDEDFEEYEQYFVKNLLEEVNLQDKELKEIEVRRFYENQFFTSQIKMTIEGDLLIIVRDYGDKKPSELLIKKNGK